MKASSVNDLVNETLQGWASLIGLTDEGDVTVKHPWGTYEIGCHTEDLNGSRTLDPTGLTTFMMLRGIVERYLKKVVFNAHDLILDPGAIADQLKPMGELKALLDDPRVVDLIGGFQGTLRDASTHYGLKATESLENLLADRYDLAHIRRDALRTIDRIEAHQFTQGLSDPNPLKFNPKIYEFWNVNSLLAAMRGQMEPGITICLIRDPEEALASYFVFAIRNGGTLTILTDRDKTPHPAYHRMSRRPDRDLQRREERNWFPYHLLNLKTVQDAMGEVKRVYAAARTQLVRLNVQGVPLCEIRDLCAEEFVWAIMVFDLIREKFWKNDHRLPELSYTGEMVVAPQALVGQTSSLVKEGFYKPLELAPLVADDVTAETTQDQWERKCTGFNRWMYDRYGSQVPDAVLNPVGSEAAKRLFSQAATGDLVHGITSEMHFEALAPVSFGTKDHVDRDRKWVARMNQMAVIRRLAEEEFENERDSVLKWYRSRIEANLEVLGDAAAKGELILPFWRAKTFGVEGETRMEAPTNVLTQRVGSDWNDAWPLYTSKGVPSVRFGSNRCLDRFALKASVFTVIQPTCPEALAVLCGVDVTDLPWPLQHWYAYEPYVGNPILGRLDPEDWKLRNPWLETNGGLSLRTGVSHSKNALHARRKTLGLPRKKFVKETKADG